MPIYVHLGNFLDQTEETMGFPVENQGGIHWATGQVFQESQKSPFAQVPWKNAKRISSSETNFRLEPTKENVSPFLPKRNSAAV